MSCSLSVNSTSPMTFAGYRSVARKVVRMHTMMPAALRVGFRGFRIFRDFRGLLGFYTLLHPINLIKSETQVLKPLKPMCYL